MLLSSELFEEVDMRKCGRSDRNLHSRKSCRFCYLRSLIQVDLRFSDFATGIGKMHTEGAYSHVFESDR